MASSSSFDSNVRRHHSGATTWSSSELQELKDAFVLFDTEQRGEISVSELRSVLQELQRDDGKPTAGGTGANSSCNLDRLQASLQGFSSNKTLTMDEFVSLLTSPNPNDTRDDTEKVFGLFDVDNKGYITLHDMRTVANDLGESYSLTDAELHDMLYRVSSAGRVTMEQFRDIMDKKLIP